MSGVKNTHIRLLALGTRGDVQPYVALGLGLQRAGFIVSIGTTRDFKEFVEGWGLPCITVPQEMHTLIAQSVQQGSITSGSASRRLTGQQRNAKWAFIRLLWEITPELAAGADVLLYSAAAILAVPHIAEKMGIPAIPALLQPAMTPTRAFPLPGLPALASGGWYNHLTYTLFESLTWIFLRASVNRWRREVLSLAPYAESGPFAPLRSTQQPVLYGFSPEVVAKPQDWGENVHVTGYWFLPSSEHWQPSVQLTEFLQAGDPPISIGFGSMVVPHPQEMMDILLTAIKQAGVRAILIAGWQGLSALHLPENVLLIEHAPHDWLFPRMASVVHHGGAGTTAASLRAGVPTIIVPFSQQADQSFWGKRVATLGVGPEPIPLKRLSADALATSIQKTIRDNTMRDKAARLGQKLHSEDGVGKAITLLSQFVGN